MPSINDSESRRYAPRRLPARSPGRIIDTVGAYLTDEVFLYRVVRLVAVGRDRMVELEDCYRLDVVRVPLRDLRRQLRLVTPAVANVLLSRPALTRFEPLR